MCELTAEDETSSGSAPQPQSVAGVAEALRTAPSRPRPSYRVSTAKFGLVRLFRYDTLRYGLPE